MGILPSFRLQGLPRHPCGRLWHGHVIVQRSTSPHLRRHSHGDWNLVVLVLRRSYHSCVPEGATAHVRVGVESKLSDPGRVGGWNERVVWFRTLQPPSLPPHRSRWNIPSMCSPRPAMRLVRTRTPSLSCLLIGPRRGEVGRGVPSRRTFVVDFCREGRGRHHHTRLVDAITTSQRTTVPR